MLFPFRAGVSAAAAGPVLTAELSSRGRGRSLGSSFNMPAARAGVVPTVAVATETKTSVGIVRRGFDPTGLCPHQMSNRPMFHAYRNCPRTSGLS